MKVLHVDDDIDILNQAKIFLEKEKDSLEVESASSAKEGLEKLEGENYDIIVSDYQMPEMDGLEFLRELREERNSDIPFIIFTGKGREEVAMEALNLGADRYLQKGRNPKTQYGVLAQAIQQEVKHHRLRFEKEKVEEKLYSLVEGSQDSIYIVDEDYRFAFANRAKLDQHDVDREELIGSKVQDFHPEEDSQEFEEKVENVLETGESQTQEVDYLEKGEYYNRTFSPVKNPKNGEIDRVSVISKEITELKEKEEELRDRKEKFRKLFENQVNGFAIFESVFDDEGNFVSYRFEDINPAYERITEVDREEVKGKDIQEVFPGTEDSWIEAYGSVAVTGESKTFEMYHGPTDKYYRCNVFRPWDTKDRFCVAFNDITDRKEYEEKLEKSRRRLEKSQSLAKVGNWMLDLDTNELSWSDETYRIFGKSKEESLTYEKFLDFIHPEDKEFVDKKWKEALDTGEYDIEHRVIVDGEVKWVREKADIRYDEDGEPVKAVGAVQDITEWKEIEE